MISRRRVSGHVSGHRNFSLQIQYTLLWSFFTSVGNAKIVVAYAWQGCLSPSFDLSSGGRLSAAAWGGMLGGGGVGRHWIPLVTSSSWRPMGLCSSCSQSRSSTSNTKSRKWLGISST